MKISLRSIVPLILFLLLIVVWHSSFISQQQNSNAEFAWYVAGLIVLLCVLFRLEAMEIAYSVLSDKLPDQFKKDEDRSFFLLMRGCEGVIYDAREWLVIIVIAIITIIAEIAVHHGLYVWHWRVPDAWEGTAKILFSVTFTTLPVIWFAQAPGKKIAKSRPRRLLFSALTRSIFAILQGINAFVEKSELDAPVKLTTKFWQQTLGPGTEETPPSDHGLFLASLHRYGFALHDLFVHIDLHPDGSCDVVQKFIIYLTGYPRDYFRRELFFDSDATSAKFLRVDGYFDCPIVKDSYDPVSNVLEEIAAGNSKLVAVSSGSLGISNPKKEAGRATFEVTTHKKLPEEGKAAALVIHCTGSWGVGAMKVRDEEEDYFEQSFRYPCRRYRLEIMPDAGLDIDFSRIEPKATFMDNPHPGEEDRLRKAREDTNQALRSTLDHPLPGAKYRFSWHVARRNSIP
jgi:hypothetical protein